MTESCGDCSHLIWGHSLLESGFVVDDGGETPGCFGAELDPGYISAVSLTAKEALDWWFPNEKKSSFNESVCPNYDGKRPTRQEIEDEIKAQQHTNTSNSLDKNL